MGERLPIATQFLVDVNEADVRRAYGVLRGGGLILVKGDIGYGLLGHSEDSIRRMFELKGRPEWNSAILIGNIPIFRELTIPLSPNLNCWVSDIARYTTIAVVNWLNDVSPLWTGLTAWARDHCSVRGSVAVFLNTGLFVERLVSLTAHDNFLVVGSSANRSFRGNNYSFEDVPPELIRGVDLALDHGRARYENTGRLATTIVDLTTRTIRRRGVNAELIEKSFSIALRQT